MRWLGIGLVLLGVLGLVLGGFFVTHEETKAEVGPLKVTVEQRDHVVIPPWLGFVAIGAGIALLLMDRRTARAK